MKGEFGHVVSDISESDTIELIPFTEEEFEIYWSCYPGEYPLRAEDYKYLTDYNPRLIKGKIKTNAESQNM